MLYVLGMLKKCLLHFGDRALPFERDDFSRYAVHWAAESASKKFQRPIYVTIIQQCKNSVPCTSYIESSAETSVEFSEYHRLHSGKEESDSPLISSSQSPTPNLTLSIAKTFPSERRAVLSFPKLKQAISRPLSSAVPRRTRNRQE